MKISLRRMMAEAACAALLAACVPALGHVVRAAEAKNAAVKSITADRSIHYEGFNDGEYVRDDQGEMFFQYDISAKDALSSYNDTADFLFVAPNTVFTITFNDGSADLVGTARQITEQTGEPLAFSAKVDQKTEHWEVGGTYDISVSFRDGTGIVKAVIDECPITKVTAISPYTIDWDKPGNELGWMTYNEDPADTYFEYSLLDLTFQVECQGKTYEISDNPTLYEYTGYTFQLDDPQRTTHWYPGNTYEVDLYLGGYKTTFSVVIPESPVKKVDLNAGTLLFFEYRDGHKCGKTYLDNGYKVYETWQNFNLDEKLLNTTGKVTYKDGSTKNFTFNESDAIGAEMLANIYSGEQYHNHWKPGEHQGFIFYKGYLFSVPVLVENDFTGFNVTPKSGVTMSLSWNAIPDAYSYDVMCSDGEIFLKIKSCGSSQTSTSHTGLTAGTSYRYKIIARDRSGNEIAVSPVKEAVALATPALQSVSMVENGLKLSWTKASGADRYNIYRSTSKDGTYEYIKSVQGVLSYVDTDVELGKTYYYKVRAYKKIDGKVYYGGYSNAGGKTYRAVNGLKASPKSGVTMTLSWSAVSGVYSYEIWAAADGSSFAKVKATGKNQLSTSHTGLTAGTRYSYKILAKDSSGNLIAVSPVVKAVALATPTIESATSVKTGVSIKWSRASGADRYNIYRSTSKDGTYEYLTSVQHVENYVDKTAKDGQTYYYKVRAYKKFDGIVYYGGYSGSAVCTFIADSGDILLPEV